MIRNAAMNCYNHCGLGNGIILNCTSCRATARIIKMVGKKQENNDYWLQDGRDFQKVSIKCIPFPAHSSGHQH